ncbi:hypothetical protein STEG23_000296, partial [Scotinomys teguina]
KPFHTVQGSADFQREISSEITLNGNNLQNSKKLPNQATYTHNNLLWTIEGNRKKGQAYHGYQQNMVYQVAIVFHYVTLAVLELILWNRLASNSQRSASLCLLSAWIKVSGSLTVSSWEKLGRNLDFAAEQGTLKSGVHPIWKLVRSCLDQCCHEAVENGQAALEILQEERSEKATSERENKNRKRKQGLYLDLTEFRDSDEGEGGSESSDEMDSIISDFVARMVEAAGRIFGDPDVAMPLIKQLVYEQCTKECREGPRMCWSIKTLQYC